jgi:hypothetical protein
MNRYWFKRKRYGYGWTPTTWQGWGVIIGYLAVVFGGGEVVVKPNSTNTQAWLYLLSVLLASYLLITTIKDHAPTGKWRWGKKSNDNAEEDF